MSSRRRPPFGVRIYSPSLALKRFIPISSSTSRVQFDSSGRLLASTSKDSRIRLWSAADGSQVEEIPLTTPVDSVSGLAFGAEGTVLAFLDADRPGTAGVVRVWDTAAHRQIATLQTANLAAGFALSADGRLVATQVGLGRVTVWRIPQRDSVLQLSVRDAGYLEGLAFSPDATLLATQSETTGVQVWRVADGTHVRTLSGSAELAWGGVRFSPDGRLIAAELGGASKVWRLADDALLGTFPVTQGGAFGPDGSYFAGTSTDALRIWRLQDGSQVAQVDGSVEAAALAVSPTSPLVAVASGNVQIRRLVDGELVCTIAVPDAAVRSVAFSSDGIVLATGAEDSGVRLYRVSDGRLLRELRGHAGPVNGVAFSPAGHVLASVGTDDRGRIWDVNTGLTLQLVSHDDPQCAPHCMSSIAWSPDGAHFATGGAQGDVRIWRTSDAFLEGELGGNDGRVESVSFNRDGTLLAQTASREILVWRVADRKLLQTLGPFSTRPTSARFSPVTDVLVSADEEAVRIWRVSDGQLLEELHAHRALFPSPVTGSVDSGRVGALAFSPDGSLIVTSGEDGTVAFWGIPPN